MNSNDVKTVFVILALFTSPHIITYAAGPVTAQTAPVARTYKTFWPPVVNQVYPELELSDLSGKKIKLSSFAGKVILLEPIGMSCPACQAFVGGATRGGINGVQPQGGVSSIDTYLQASGVSPADPRLVRIQLLLYGPSLGVPTRAEGYRQ